MRVAISIFVLSAALALSGAETPSGEKEPEVKKKGIWGRLKASAAEQANKTVSRAEESAGDTMKHAGDKADEQITKRTEAASQKLDKAAGVATITEREKTGTAAPAKRK